MEKFLERIPLERITSLWSMCLLSIPRMTDISVFSTLRNRRLHNETCSTLPFVPYKYSTTLKSKPDCKKKKKRKETKEKQEPSHCVYVCVCLYVLCWQKSKPVVAHWVKNLPAMQETQVQFLHWKDPLKEGTATHSSILAWRIPRTEEPGGL